MHILIVRNNSNSQAQDASLLLVTYLATQGIDYTVVDSSKLASPLAAPELSALFDHGVDMAVALGGDGLVVASATGSTAYALSAGGPLVAPGFTGLVAVPIAPHTLHSRAVVTSPSDVIEMDLSENADGRDATLFIDGELVELDRPLRRLYVRRGPVATTLLRYKDEGFYNHAAKVFF